MVARDTRSPIRRDRIEIPTYQNLAIPLHSDVKDKDKTACVRIARVWVERIGQAGRRIEPADAVARLATDVREIAARQDLTVRLHHDGMDLEVRARVE